MSVPVKKSLRDSALILIGATLSVLFMSADGNGQNPIPVAAHIGIVVLVNGIISLVATKFIRSLPFAIAASIVITDLFFITCAVWDLAYRSTDKYAGEAALMFPIIFGVETAPTVVLSSIGFNRLARRFWLERRGSSIAARHP